MDLLHGTYEEEQLFTWRQWNMLTPDPHWEWTQVFLSWVFIHVYMYKGKQGCMLCIGQEVRVEVGWGQKRMERKQLWHLPVISARCSLPLCTCLGCDWQCFNCVTNIFNLCVLWRTSEKNVSQLNFSDQSCLYTFTMSPCTGKSECVNFRKKIRKMHLGLNAMVI